MYVCCNSWLEIKITTNVTIVHLLLDDNVCESLSSGLLFVLFVSDYQQAVRIVLILSICIQRDGIAF